MASYQWPPTNATSGTVTSVGLADGSTVPIYSISGSPVVGSGTLTFTLATETANQIFAGPTTGAAAQPTFRTQVLADLPAIATQTVLGNTTGGSAVPTAVSLGTVSEATSSVLTLTGFSNATIGSPTIQVKQSSAILSGYLSSTDWSTFNNKQAALTIGNLTDAGTDGIVITSGTGAVIGSGTSIAQHVADTTHNGYLSSTDWNTFNGKQAALTIGNLTDVGTDGIVITSGTGAVIGSGTSIAQHVADTTHNGYLSSTDWNTFNGKGAGSVTSVAMTVPTFLSVSGTPVTGSGTLAVSLSGTALPIANGGTAVTSVTIAPAATAFAGWDANKNLSANNLLQGYRTTATAAGTTTLVIGDAFQQYFTGSTTQTVLLPVTNTLVLGHSFTIVNLSSGIVTVQSSGANTIQAMGTNTELAVTCISTSGTGVASWSAVYASTSPATVTSVGLSVPAASILGVTGTPVTTSGTLGLTTTGTSGGIPYFSSTSALSSSALLTANQLIVGGGAGTTPATLAAGSQYQSLRMGATTPAYGSINLDQSAAVTGTLPVGNGGTGVTSVTIAPAATAFAGWDANKNLSANNHIEGFATTATAAGTTTLVVGSAQLQYFTGSTTQTVVLPVASTLVQGQQFTIYNLSTGLVTVQSSGANNLQAMAANTQLTATCILTSGTGIASWSWQYSSLLTLPRSEIYLDTGNGHGSSSTKVRRMTNTRLNTGTAMTYAGDSSTLGVVITINEAGIYSVYYSDYKAAGVPFIAVTVNASSLTTNAVSLTYANGRRLGINCPVAAEAGTASWTGALAVNDVIRPMDDGTCDSTDGFCAFSICKVSN